MRRLYTFFRSSTSYRLRIALCLKGLEWEPHYVSLPRMEHRASGYMTLNPQGLVPALIEDDGSGAEDDRNRRSDDIPGVRPPDE